LILNALLHEVECRLESGQTHCRNSLPLLHTYDNV
jgi:hypothetical protein